MIPCFPNTTKNGPGWWHSLWPGVHKRLLHDAELWSLQLWILLEGSDEKATHHRDFRSCRRHCLLMRLWERGRGQKKVPKPPSGKETFAFLTPEYCGFPTGLGLDQISLCELTWPVHGNLAVMHFQCFTDWANYLLNTSCMSDTVCWGEWGKLGSLDLSSGLKWYNKIK